MTKDEMEKRFFYCLDNFLVDVPSDFYNEGKNNLNLFFRNSIQKS